MHWTLTIRTERTHACAPIIDQAHETFDPVCGEDTGCIDECLYLIQKKIVRAWLYEGKRVDGRGIDEIRPLDAEVALLPRVHGSGLFTRGQTQVLTVATLAPVSESQKLDGLDEETTKRYMHQYNFPSYSVGETKPSRGPGRREIGHGALAERALVPVLPSVEDFPYAMRLVSEVLSSNGSTSQASICGSTLALMDAGVPIKAPVAGISCGLITLPNSQEFKTMVDIQGLEDFFGDMDFKVGGTKKGITAIQVDIKVDGLTPEIIREAFEKTRKARLYILDEVMAKAIAQPRDHVAEYAPKMVQIKIPVDKIREVIGQGGKVIQKISADCDVKIDVNEDGHVFISGISQEGCDKAYQIIETIAIDPEVGSIYKGKVVSIKPFGAFVEIAPGRDGLVHISKLDKERVESVEDVVSVGDAIIVKVMEIKDGKISLSRKDALEELSSPGSRRQKHRSKIALHFQKQALCSFAKNGTVLFVFGICLIDLLQVYRLLQKRVLIDEVQAGDFDVNRRGGVLKMIADFQSVGGARLDFVHLLLGIDVVAANDRVVAFDSVLKCLVLAGENERLRLIGIVGEVILHNQDRLALIVLTDTGSEQFYLKFGFFRSSLRNVLCFRFFCCAALCCTALSCRGFLCL